MARIHLLGIFAAAAFPALVASTTMQAAPPVTDDFNEGSFRHGPWNLCQAEERLLWFDRIAPLEGKHSLTIGVDDRRKGEVSCNAPVAKASVTGDGENDVEYLGPSLIGTVRSGSMATGVLRRDIHTVIQRHELRLRTEYRHPIRQTHWYGFSFRMDGKIPSTGSTRWVIGQWKQTNGSSPILAQRFDNGVFHISVQDGHCRCRIAEAGGNPDLRTAPLSSKPLRCVWAPDEDAKKRRGDLKVGDNCETSLAVTRGEGFILPDPNAGWVNMIYSIRGGRDGNGKIDIYANRKFVARVTGPIGYDNWRGQKVKFKIGMYRDFLSGSAYLHFDRFWVGRDPAVYEPGFRPRP